MWKELFRWKNVFPALGDLVEVFYTDLYWPIHWSLAIYFFRSCPKIFFLDDISEQRSRTAKKLNPPSPCFLKFSYFHCFSYTSLLASKLKFEAVSNILSESVKITFRLVQMNLWLSVAQNAVNTQICKNRQAAVLHTAVIIRCKLKLWVVWNRVSLPVHTVSHSKCLWYLFKSNILQWSFLQSRAYVTYNPLTQNLTKKI